MMLLIICRRRILVLCIYMPVSSYDVTHNLQKEDFGLVYLYMPVSSYDATHNLQKEDFGLVYLYACLFL